MNTVRLRVQVATAMAVLLPLAAVVLIEIVAHSEGRERPRGAGTIRNEKQIVAAAKMYVDEWDTAFPVLVGSRRHGNADEPLSSQLAVRTTFDLLYPWEKRHRWPGLYIQQCLNGSCASGG